MSHKKFNLTWKTYTDHLRGMLHSMMSSSELTDVTLVSEDKKQFKAHKVVLIASSPVFKSIISDNFSSTPIIYLRGVHSNEIESILQFIYIGQTTFYQKRMNEFLNVGKSLEIQEISKFLDRKECSDGEEQVSDKNHEPDEVANSDTENGQMNEITYNKKICICEIISEK